MALGRQLADNRCQYFHQRLKLQMEELVGACLTCHVCRVDIVHTLEFGLARIAFELLRIPHVSGGVQCLRGRECSSSPTSGTHDPSSEGFLL
jgi:hypothetical protein